MEGWQLNSVKAVAVGIATGIGGTFAFGVIAALVLGALSGLEADPAAVIWAAVYRSTQGEGYLLLNLIGGAVFIASGGFHAARIAEDLPFVHVAIVGMAATLMSIPLAPSGAALSIILLAVGSAMPAALLGGALGARR